MKRIRALHFIVFVFLLIVVVWSVVEFAPLKPAIKESNDIQNGELRPNESKIIDAPYIAQTERYPTGCEATTAVMALRYAGVEITVEYFIDNYLETGTAPYEYNGMIYGDSPWNCFLGSPYEESGLGCYSPVIQRALQKVLDGSDYSVSQFLSKPLNELCSEYIDNDIPVILWATTEMKEAASTSSWITPDEEKVTWISPEHCLLLVGYDDDNYYFNDSRKGKQKAYNKLDVETAYENMLSQAVVITKIG